ncbi:MAG: glucuronate isomerase [Balneolaceae bacterium]|nr:glucuronate isomerase [Balneolaceae bacterium]
MNTLGEAADVDIASLDDLLEALFNRIDFFHQHGCRLSDHGLRTLCYEPVPKSSLDRHFETILEGGELNPQQQAALKYHYPVALARRYNQKGWVQQYHLGALRNASSRMMDQLGADAGFDSIGDFPQAEAMAKFFNELDRTDQLAKTVIYNLNPADNAVFATMTGNFNDGSVRGKCSTVPPGGSWTRKTGSRSS